MPPLSLHVAIHFLGILRTRRSSNIMQTSPRSHRKRTRRKPYNNLNLMAVMQSAWERIICVETFTLLIQQQLQHLTHLL